jgi:hypothetical protein
VVYVAGTSSGNSAPPATFGRRKCKYLVEVPYVYYLCSPVPGQLLRSARSIRMSGSDARWLVIERRRVVSELRVLRSGKWLGCGSRLTRAKRDELVIEQLKRNILRSCNCNPGETPKGDTPGDIQMRFQSRSQCQISRIDRCQINVYDSRVHSGMTSC